MNTWLPSPNCSASASFRLAYAAACTPTTVIARLDRAIQYSETVVIHGWATAYRMPRSSRGMTPVSLRRRLLAGLVDRDVLAMGERLLSVRHDEGVELDEAVALLLVIRGDFRARDDLVAGTCG